MNFKPVCHIIVPLKAGVDDDYLESLSFEDFVLEVEDRYEEMC